MVPLFISLWHGAAGDYSLLYPVKHLAIQHKVWELKVNLTVSDVMKKTLKGATEGYELELGFMDQPLCLNPIYCRFT